MPAETQGRREKAAALFAGGMTKKDAMIEAGYSYTPAAATRFFKHPTVAARVKELLKRREAAKAAVASKAVERAGVTREWVADRLKYVAEVAIRGAPVRDKATGDQLLDTQGRPIFDGKMQLTAATRALQLLGVDLGMFVQKHEIGDPGEFARLSNDELEERVAKDMAALGVDQETIDLLIAQAGFTEESLTVGEA